IACDGRGTCGSPGLNCPGYGCFPDAGRSAACTAEGQGVQGTVRTTTNVYLSPDSCPFNTLGGMPPHPLLTSAADVQDAFPRGASSEIANIDFTQDRVLLWSSNPGVEFVVDDGRELVVAEAMFCQGEGPTCTAHVLHDTTRNALRTIECPYKGPNPCL